MVQPWMICSADSSLALQISQVAESIICFFSSTDRHLILLWVSSHINSWTLGGAKVFQMNFALGSSPWPLALIILYSCPLSRDLSAHMNAEHLLPGSSLSWVESSMSWTTFSSCAAIVESLGTNEVWMPKALTAFRGDVLAVQWDSSEGNRSSKGSSPIQTSYQNEEVLPSPTETVVIAW